MAETHREKAPRVDPAPRHLEGAGDDVPCKGDNADPQEVQELQPGRASPAVVGYDIAGWYLPAEETGGDFFDFQDLPAGGLAVILGDVSGHGSGPAQVAATCCALFRATLSRTLEPAEVITEVNQLLCRNELDDRFVTAFFGVLHHEGHRLTYASAGQGPILYYSRAKGTIDELVIQGFPLGLPPGLCFGPSEDIELGPGDILALVTDGFFEWFNNAGECFGIERTKAQLTRDRDQPAAEIMRRLHACVRDFAGGSPQPDDLTAVVIKRLA